MTLFDRLVLSVWMLNAYDAAITVYGTTAHGATEVNPLMALCLAAGVLVFLAVKLGLMTAVCLVMRQKARRGRKSWGLLWSSLVVFTTLCVWNTYLIIKVAAG